MDVAALLAWYDAGHRDLPWRRSTDPWAILVSEVMLQQTQAARVVPYYERFLERFPSPGDIATAAPAHVLAAWSGLGYNRRALALQAAGRHVAEQGWPEDLRELPGVGPYTAAAVASFAFGRQVAAVDTNVRRVIDRHRGRRHTARELDAHAGRLLPAGRAATFNQAMMELGATVCSPRRPACDGCPVAAGCAAHRHGLPEPPPRTRTAQRFEDTDRWLRGRVVAALLAREPLPDAAPARMERVLAALERDGLVVRAPGAIVELPSSGGYRMPPANQDFHGGPTVALDRQSIEKRDFPIGRRGYDPDAVDSHLALLADEVEGLKRASRQRGDTLASAASEQVRLIVEAAEQSAGDIEREADLEARRIRQEAREAAEKLRSEAGTQAREHVQRVSEAAGTMLERIESIDGELRTLLESLRSGANRVSADLALLQGSVGDLRGSGAAGAGAGASGFEPESAPVPAAARGASPEPAVAADDLTDDLDAEDEPFEDAEDEAAGSGGGDRPADEEGARLIALNMALNGTPREETEQYLQENFDLPDPEALLDDVYARAGQ